jgi:hypothetical protein
MIPFVTDGSSSPRRTRKTSKNLASHASQMDTTGDFEVSIRRRPSRATVAPPKQIVRSHSRYNLRP